MDAAKDVEGLTVPEIHLAFIDEVAGKLLWSLWVGFHQAEIKSKRMSKEQESQYATSGRPLSRASIVPPVYGVRTR